MFFRSLPQKISPEEITQRLIETAANAAFRIFRDKKFRGMLDFNNQTQVEQDRFFNELVVTVLILVHYILEEVSIDATGEIGSLWQEIKNDWQKTYLNWLKEIGIENQYANVWGKLIKMRLEEYDRDKIEMRRQMTESKDFQDQILNIRFIRVQVLAIGCLNHLLRGKENSKDPLYLYLLKWLTQLNIKIEKFVRA